MEQIDAASEGQMNHGCLTLFQSKYERDAYKNRKDIKFVVAPGLTVVSASMFGSCRNLEIIYAPNVEIIEDNNDDIAYGSFS